MKKLLMSSIVLTIFATASIIFQMSSCKKADAQTNCPTPTYQIAGLWIGTYTYLTQPPLYFSFTIYPDGTMSYKSKGNNGYTFYANGTWTLNGTTLSYSVTTTNNPGGTQQTQTGTATYSNSGTLTNGIHADAISGLSSTWSMTRVN
jgi:hypothetical protein